MTNDFADVGSGQYVLVIADDFIRYPEEVDFLSSLTPKVVIPKLEGLFATLGNTEHIDIGKVLCTAADYGVRGPGARYYVGTSARGVNKGVPRDRFSCAFPTFN